MRDAWTPAAERHHLLPAEREAFERARRGGLPPRRWIALEGSLPPLWVGPGLTVARQSCGLLDLIEGEEARALLVQHAFRVTREQRMQAHNLLPPGTPIPEAIAALAAAFPQFAPVDVSATGALFMCPPKVNARSTWFSSTVVRGPRSLRATRHLDSRERPGSTGLIHLCRNRLCPLASRCPECGSQARQSTTSPRSRIRLKRANEAIIHRWLPRA